MLDWLSGFFEHLWKRKNKDEKNLAAVRQANLNYLGSTRKTIDDYRHRFKLAPIGHWSQNTGTFGIVMDEIWEFKSDRTGKIIEIGPFGGERGETLFEWKEVADLTIACEVTKCSDDEDEDLEPATWVTIRYDFKITPTDCGDVIAMYQVDVNGTFQSSFWYSLTPLMNNDHW